MKVPLCACGCGMPVTWNKFKRRWNLCCKGHNNPQWTLPQTYCHCGCGGLASPGMKFIHSHNGGSITLGGRKRISEGCKEWHKRMKGTKEYLSRIKKISKSLSGENHFNYGKKWEDMYSEEMCCSLMNRLKNEGPGFKKGEKNWSKKNGAWNKGLTKETSEGVKKISDYQKGKPGMIEEDNPFYGRHHTEETKQKIRVSLAPKLHLCLDYSNRKPNYLEKKLDNILQDNFPGEFKFVGDGSFVIEGKNPDFVNCNGKKQIIEFFGDHWHKPEDEGKRRKIFKEYGYKTLVIWGHEMKEKEKVMEKLIEFVRGEK